MKNIFKNNFLKQCKELGVPLYQCPVFLFIIMGVVVILAILAGYFFSIKYGLAPEIQALVSIFVAFVTFTIGHFVVDGFSKLAEANFLKSQFLSIVSHQLLTPLSSLKWALNVLDSNNINTTKEEKEELFKIISKSNETMISMIESLLDVSRLEMGKIKFDRSEVDLSVLAHEIIDERKNDASVKENTIKLDCKDDIPFVLVDRKRIKVAMDNLLSNAVKFSNVKKEIVVSVFSEDGKVFFSVEDFGVGISKKERRRIYSKFFKTNNPLKYQNKGFGLGLFMAKFVIDQMGGEMDFESKENVGSKFWFYLPVYGKK